MRKMPINVHCSSNHLVQFFSWSYLKKPQMLIIVYHQIRYLASCPNTNATGVFSEVCQRTVSRQPGGPLWLLQRDIKDGKRICSGLVHHLLVRIKEYKLQQDRHQRTFSPLSTQRQTYAPFCESSGSKASMILACNQGKSQRGGENHTSRAF